MRFLYGLLLLVPVAVGLRVAGVGHTWIFLASAAALIPLSALLGNATEELAAHTGPRVGGLLNVTLGNAAELIITVAAIREGLLDLVKASIAGSILGNILLVLGASLLVGGLRHGQQKFDAQNAGMASTMMTLAVAALAIPAVFTFGPHRVTGLESELLSIGVAVVLMVLYALYVLFTIFLQPDEAAGAPHGEGKVQWSVRTSLAVLAAGTVGAVAMSELLVEAVEPVAASWGLTELFLGVILVPLIGNAAEHWAAVQAAANDQMDLSIGIAIGSSLQVALFVAPLLVFVSLLLGNPLQLVFNEYELTALIGAVVVATLISVDGESNWVEGAQLLAVYLIAGMGFLFLS